MQRAGSRVTISRDAQWVAARAAGPSCSVRLLTAFFSRSQILRPVVATPLHGFGPGPSARTSAFVFVSAGMLVWVGAERVVQQRGDDGEDGTRLESSTMSSTVETVESPTDASDLN